MNKRTKKLLGLMDAADNAATKAKKEVSIKNQTKSVVKPPPPPPTITKTTSTSTGVGSSCVKCGEPCHYDFNKMVQVNDRNGKRHWCPFGDPPKSIKCKECGGDMIFNQLYYDDFRGMFIPLNRDMTPHKCRNEKKKRQMMTPLLS